MRPGGNDDVAGELSALLATEEAGAWCDADVLESGDALSTTGDAAGGDDEESLDQNVAESRQQIKMWLRALENGDREPLPPVLPPIRGPMPTSNYSMKLRGSTASWQRRWQTSG